VKISVPITIGLHSSEKVIEHCYHECPWFGLDGGPGPVMTCNHPNVPVFPGVPEGFGVISHPECTEGFPKLCPLVKEVSG
jgi:hypothetical protein